MAPLSQQNVASTLWKTMKVADKESYESVSSDESDVTLLDEKIKLRQRTPFWRRCMPVLCMLYVVGSLAGLSALSWKLERVVSEHDSARDSSMSPNTTLERTGSELGDCGKSIAEARAAGCHFDPMSWLWVPHNCYKHENLINDWKARTEWHFYTSVNMLPEEEVSLESVYRGDYPTLYTHYKYHKIHCSYSWQKQHAILSQRLPIDDNTLSKRHMHHCQMVLLNEFFHEDVNCTESAEQICPIRLIQEFTKCGEYW